MKLLYINTAEMGQVSVKCVVDGKEYVISKKQKFGSQVLLELIEQVLKESRLKMEDLEEIKVNTGPGSFTGLRVGVSVANALGFSLGIPVNDKKMEVIIKYQ